MSTVELPRIGGQASLFSWRPSAEGQAVKEGIEITEVSNGIRSFEQMSYLAVPAAMQGGDGSRDGIGLDSARVFSWL